MRHWKQLSQQAIKDRIFNALDANIDYVERKALGLPASHLDEKVFYNNPIILRDAPFLTSLLRNPNHIGCHTLGESEPFFQGTHSIERELIALCAEDILLGEPDQQDGYVAAGGTEANLQAIWVYRNYFRNTSALKPQEVAIICSADTHYSMDKASDVLQVQLYKIQVDPNNRSIDLGHLTEQIQLAQKNGVKAFIGVANMMTTMFGSADEVDHYAQAFKQTGLPYRIHVDGAYGGFVYPFLPHLPKMDFSHPEVTSITLDAHKMVQAPYGTGIFLIRKGFIHHVYTKEAEYVAGLDATLSGSRSGANAISVWMILQTYGPHGWYEKIHLLSHRTDWLSSQLKDLGITHYRYPNSNIVTIQAGQFPDELAHEFGLVPDLHSGPANWYKVVVMDHVTVDAMEPFVAKLRSLSVR